MIVRLFILLLVVGCSCLRVSASIPKVIVTKALQSTITPSSERIIYVNQQVTAGNGSGDSWHNAVPELAEALKWAKINEAEIETSPLQIWVAAGTYLPKYHPHDLTSTNPTSDLNSFLLVKNVSLYGGFSGTETSLTERNPNLHKTIISGDYNDDDELIGEVPSLQLQNNYENAIRLLIGIGDLGNARLDGFQISHTKAPYSNYEVTVAGVDLISCSALTLVNSNLAIDQCHFTKLNGDQGSALLSKNSRVSVQQSLFTQNIGSWGTVSVTDQVDGVNTNSFTIANSVFANNFTQVYGAGIDFFGMADDNPGENIVVNCTFVNNRTRRDMFDVGIALSGSHAKIYNSIVISADQPQNKGVEITSSGSSFEIKNCLSQGLTSTLNGNINASGLTHNDLFVDASNGNYNIKYTSPAFNKGDKLLYSQHLADPSTSVDLNGQLRLVNAQIDMGALESQDLDLPLSIALQTDSGISATDGITNDNTPTYGGITAPFAEVTLTINETTIGGVTVANELGEWSITVSQPLADGTYQVMASAQKTGYVFVPTPALTTNIDVTPPTISGVANQQVYEDNRTITFNEGTALLNGSAFASGSLLSEGGTHTLVVTDLAGNSTTITFTIETITITPSQDRIIYVNKQVVGGNKSGDSWQNATPELADALAYAKLNAANWTAETRLQIWVAAGNYKPLYRVDDVTRSGQRDKTFLMVSFVDLYGGFSGEETSLSQRNWSVNATVLDGDLLQNDVTTLTGESLMSHSSRSDNAYHVVSFVGNTDPLVMLDGFQIINGNANDFNINTIENIELMNYAGGGIIAVNANPKIKNSVFRYNSAYYGGGIYAGMYMDGWIGKYSETMLNCIFEKNHAAYDGSAIHGEAVQVYLINSTVLEHSYSQGHIGSAIRAYNTNYTIANSILFPQIPALKTHSYNAADFSNVKHSIIYGNTANNNIDANTLSLADLFIDPQAGNYQPKPGSVGINAGNVALYNAFSYAMSDVDFLNTNRVSGGNIDLGPYEFQEPCPVIDVPTTSALTQAFCGTATVSDLQATPAANTTLNWFTSATGGTPLLASSYLSEDTAIYYAESTGMGCVSTTRLAVTVTVELRPDEPIAENVSYTLNEVAQPLVATALPGHTLTWYDDYGQPITSPIPSTTSTGTTYYYVTQSTANGCEGDSKEVQVAVFSAIVKPDERGIVYVNKQVVAGNGQGTSWENAVAELGDALEFAKLNNQIREIWVAAGTYYPLYGGDGGFSDYGYDNRFAIENLKLYGGFNGTETTREARNWKLNPTILTAERGDLTDIEDNCDIIVSSYDAASETILDGFTIEGAYGYGPAGIYLSSSSARHIVNHCIIRNNKGSQAGGLFATNVDQLYISNSLIHNNQSTYGVGGIFSFNSVEDHQQIQITNSIVTSNTGSIAGGIAAIGAMAIQNSIIWNNNVDGSTTIAGADIAVSNNDITVDIPTLTNTITQVFGNSPTSRTTSSLVGVDPQFTNPTAGDFSLQAGSPAINAGDNTQYNSTLLGTRDLNGLERLRDTTIDLGAFEVQEGDNPLPVTLVRFTGQVEGPHVNLAWQTTDEVNTSHFEVERSDDGQRFTTTGRVVANQTGDHVYQFLDLLSTSEGVQYYRLKMVDLDGSYAYSQLISINRQAGVQQSSLSVYPNPLQNGERIIIEVSSATLAGLYTSSGQLVQYIPLKAGKNHLNFPDLVAGTYLINDGLGNTIKLLVMR